MILEKMFDLIFNGKKVGSRIKYKGKLYDMSFDDLRLVLEDFEVRLESKSIKQPVNLIEQGNLLVPLGEPSADELSYGVIAQLLGKSHLSKSDVQLKLDYNRYNIEIFGGQLPKDVCVYWSNRMTAGAGVAKWKYRKGTGELFDIHIGLSVPYHQKYTDEIKDTLVHEMIHIKHPREGHGMWFHFEKDRINREHGMNISVRATGHATDEKNHKRRFIYACRSCGQEYPRVRRAKNDYRDNHCGRSRCKGEIYLKQILDDDDDMNWNVDVDW